jgi:protein involved in polysaccharide export with SLBB domain
MNAERRNVRVERANGSMVRGILLGWLAVSTLACTAPCQQGDQQYDRTRDGRQNDSRKYSAASELTRSNLARVAASAGQIREVLVKDVGLMVELKRWIAKDAADNGQVVEDSSLTDEAIFERLARDVEFRSYATLLLQQYGYLTPTLNPESDLGKQQELLLQARARKTAQLEAQQEAASLQPQLNTSGQQKEAECGPRQDDGCAAEEKQLARRRENQGGPTRSSAPSALEQTEPETPIRPYLPPQVLRANANTSDPSSVLQPGFADGLGKSVAGSGTLTNTSFSGSGGAAATGLSPSMIDSILSGKSAIPPEVLAGLAKGNTSEPAPQAQTFETTRRKPPLRAAADTADPVRMVHRPNPYADVPSLYDMYVQASVRQKPLERFGLDVFRNNSDQPDVIPMDLPVGPDYVVGPGDGLAIDLWGATSQRIVRTVDRQGRVSLPEAGPVLVSGRNLAEVQELVQHTLREQFRDISADISLSRLRTVRVYVVGEVNQPGAYDVSSLSTPLNALFAAGGITGRGSLRTVKHYRGKTLVQEVDAYDLLLHGVRSDMQRIENGDTLMVPTIGSQVTIDGAVRRPSIYELQGEKTLADALELAGGMLPTASLRHVEVQRIDAHEKRTMLSLDLSANENSGADAKALSDFAIRDGDEIHVFPIASYNQDAIYLQGHVLRPGRYSYRQGMTLHDVIASYQDLLPEPAPKYAEIIRLKAPDFRPAVESFDLAAALEIPGSSPKLEPLDTIRIFSRYDFEPSPKVWVGGEVGSPGEYATSGQVRLRDAVYLASGLTQDASLDSAQLFRTERDGSMKIFSVNLKGALSGNSTDNILLQPRDRLLIHRNIQSIEPATVYIKGEVAKPGRYPLTANMHVEDLIQAAGGLKRSAYTQTADLTRFAAGEPEHGTSEQLTVDLTAANRGESGADLALRDGDVLAIRQVPGWNDLGSSVTVRGEVQHPGTYGIRPGERLSSVLERAGGYSAEAYPYGALLTRQEVREAQSREHDELVRRIEAEQVHLKLLPENDTEQKAAKQNALAQTHATLEQLRSNPPVGRMVIHIQDKEEKWKNSPEDPVLRAGDILTIPKKVGYVMVNGQVFNPTAVGYRPGRSANWYLSQAGGLTQLADKKATFVVRADGSVISAKNNSGWFSGDPLNAVLKPGDQVVVPEKAINVGTKNWTAIVQLAQIAASVAVTASYLATK